MAGLVVTYWNIEWVFYITGIAMLATLPILIVQKEHFVPEKLNLRGTMRQTGRNIKMGARYSVNKKTVLFLLMAMFFLAIGGEFIMMLRQPWMANVGIARELWGYLFAIGSVICVGAPFLAKWIAQRSKNSKPWPTTTIFWCNAAPRAWPSCTRTKAPR